MFLWGNKVYMFILTKLQLLGYFVIFFSFALPELLHCTYYLKGIQLWEDSLVHQGKKRFQFWNIRCRYMKSTWNQLFHCTRDLTSLLVAFQEENCRWKHTQKVYAILRKLKMPLNHFAFVSFQDTVFHTIPPLQLAMLLRCSLRNQ